MIQAEDKCYSTDEEVYQYETLGEAMDAIDGDFGLEDGQIIYEGDAVRRTPSHYFRMDHLLDNMSERANDEGGEWADGFPSLTKEKHDELDALIKGWLDANLTVGFYTVENVKRIEITQAMIDEYHAPATGETQA